jgi:predicted benzoate:H+ symporter BenE
MRTLLADRHAYVARLVTAIVLGIGGAFWARVVGVLLRLVLVRRATA